MPHYEYKLVTDAHIAQKLRDDQVPGVVRVETTLNALGHEGWRVVQFTQSNFGLNFWALMERELNVSQ